MDELKGSEGRYDTGQGDRVTMEDAGQEDLEHMTEN